MKLRRKLFAAVSSLAVAATVLLTGCGAPAQEGTALKETGTLTLSVNPEIQIEYNRDGKVTALTGRMMARAFWRPIRIISEKTARSSFGI